MGFGHSKPIHPKYMLAGGLDLDEEGENSIDEFFTKKNGFIPPDIGLKWKLKNLDHALDWVDKDELRLYRRERRKSFKKKAEEHAEAMKLQQDKNATEEQKADAAELADELKTQMDASPHHHRHHMKHHRAHHHGKGHSRFASVVRSTTMHSTPSTSEEDVVERIITEDIKRESSSSTSSGGEEQKKKEHHHHHHHHQHPHQHHHHHRHHDYDPSHHQPSRHPHGRHSSEMSPDTLRRENRRRAQHRRPTDTLHLLYEKPKAKAKPPVKLQPLEVSDVEQEEGATIQVPLDHDLTKSEAALIGNPQRKKPAQIVDLLSHKPWKTRSYKKYKDWKKNRSKENFNLYDHPEEKSKHKRHTKGHKVKPHYSHIYLGSTEEAAAAEEPEQSGLAPASATGGEQTEATSKTPPAEPTVIYTHKKWLGGREVTEPSSSKSMELEKSQTDSKTKILGPSKSSSEAAKIVSMSPLAQPSLAPIGSTTVLAVAREFLNKGKKPRKKGKKRYLRKKKKNTKTKHHHEDEQLLSDYEYEKILKSYRDKVGEVKGYTVPLDQEVKEQNFESGGKSGYETDKSESQEYDREESSDEDVRIKKKKKRKLKKKRRTKRIGLDKDGNTSYGKILARAEFEAKNAKILQSVARGGT